MTDVGGISEKLLWWRRRFHRAQVRWSAIHFATAYGAAILAAITSVLAGREANPTLTASLAVAAAVLAAAARVGRFEAKWRSARLSRGQIDGLLNDLAKSHPDTDQVLDALTQVVQAHDNVVVKPTTEEPLDS
jgi:hypothetical protein